MELKASEASGQTAGVEAVVALESTPGCKADLNDLMDMALLRDGASYALVRTATVDSLLDLLMAQDVGLVPLCYHRFNMYVDMDTGRPFETREQLQEYLDGGKDPEGKDDDPEEDRELWVPTTDYIEQPHQEILRREGWHTEILQVLRQHCMVYTITRLHDYS